VGQRDQGAAAGGAVEFGDDQAGELHRVIESRWMKPSAQATAP
jgi:hypothetical protein